MRTKHWVEQKSKDEWWVVERELNGRGPTKTGVPRSHPREHYYLARLDFEHITNAPPPRPSKNPRHHSYRATYQQGQR